MYEWDEHKRQMNVAKHRVDFAAMASFEWDSALEFMDRRHDEPRWVAIGYIDLRLHTVGIYGTWQLCPDNQPSPGDFAGAKILCRNLSRGRSLQSRGRKRGFGLALTLTQMRLSLMPSGSTELAQCARPTHKSSGAIGNGRNNRKSVNPLQRNLTGQI